MEAQLKKGGLFLLLLITFPVFGQISFYKIYSGNGYDRGEGICQLADDSYLITGSSSSFEEAPSQAFLLHLDPYGNYLWSKAYGGSESEEGKRVMAVEGYGYYIAGTSSSSGSGDFDNYLLFTNTSGERLWDIYTDNGGWERIHDAVMLSDTSIFAVGETDAGSPAVSDMFITRYSKNGVLLWSLELGSDEGSDVAYAAQIASDTSVLVAGTRYVEDSLKNKAYIALLHIDGSVIWEKTYGNEGVYQLNEVTTRDGLVKALGQRIKNGKTDHDIYNVTVHIEDGEFISSEEHYMDDDARYTAAVQYEPGNQGHFLVAQQSINPNTPTFPDGEDALLIRFNDGLYWDGYGVNYSGIGQDQFNQMIPTSDVFAIAVGFTSYFGAGGSSIMVVKIGDGNEFPPAPETPDVYDLVFIEELHELKTLEVYPNPVNDQLFITVSEKEFTYTLRDATGKQLTSGSAFANGQIDVSQHAAGIYFLTIAHASGEQTTVRVIRH